MAHHIYDNHTFFIKCDCATVNQIRASFNEALTKYQTDHNINLNCRFRVNLVENREGKSFGIAFVFVTNPAVYYMLLGKNPDGSDRIVYMDDPSWVPPPKGSTTNDAGWSMVSKPVLTSGISWADWDDYAEDNEPLCPKIPVHLEPLMILPPYHLTPEQVNAKRCKIIRDNEGNQNFDDSIIEIPSICHFIVDRAIAEHVEDKYMPNILKCKNIPKWITKDDLKVQFAPYATDSITIQERYIKGRRIEETYPFVNISDDRVAFIIFDSSTNDAMFALHMMKKTIITKKVNSETLTSGTLIFSHSFRVDRDLVMDINQKDRPMKYNKSRGYHNQGFRDRKNGSHTDTPHTDEAKHAAINAIPPRRNRDHKLQQQEVSSNNYFSVLSADVPSD